MAKAGIPLLFLVTAFVKSSSVLYWSTQLVASPFSVHDKETLSASTFCASFMVGLGQVAGVPKTNCKFGRL